MTGGRGAGGLPPARRSLGQHFLHDAGVIARIVAAVGPGAADHVVEIGPGRGALTAALLAAAGRLDVVEVDRELAARLRASWPALHVHEADALRFDYATLRDADEPLRVVGNLPYNISTPLLFHLLAQAPLFRDLHVMLQKEVVERMVAAPGTREYGRLTVALAARCRVVRLFDIGSGAFTPPPKVRSSFARLVPDPGLASTIASGPALDRLLVQAFSMRRKRLGNALKGLLTEAEMRGAGADPDARPGVLPPPVFVALANVLASRAAR